MMKKKLLFIFFCRSAHSTHERTPRTRCIQRHEHSQDGLVAWTVVRTKHVAQKCFTFWLRQLRKIWVGRINRVRCVQTPIRFVLVSVLNMVNSLLQTGARRSEPNISFLSILRIHEPRPTNSLHKTVNVMVRRLVRPIAPNKQVKRERLQNTRTSK